jgi:hypothetical protein
LRPAIARNPAFRQHCTVTFNQGVTTVVVAQDNDGQLTLTVGSPPTYTPADRVLRDRRGIFLYGLAPLLHLLSVVHHRAFSLAGEGRSSAVAMVEAPGMAGVLRQRPEID